MKKQFTLALSILGGLALVLSGCTTDGTSSLSSTTSDSTSSSSGTTTSSNDNQILISEVAEILLGDIYSNEVNLSNRVVYNGTEDREYSYTTYNETWTIYNDETAYATGNNVMTFENDESGELTNQDNYKHIVQTKNYQSEDGSAEVIYFVTDFENETYQPWSDDASRLPIIPASIGDPDLDGVDYLLDTSVPGQLSKQASLYAYNFIATILGQTNGIIPYAISYEEGDNLVYELEDFIFEADDLEYTYNFKLTINNSRLLSASLTTIQSEGSGEDTYSITISDNYQISYEERTSFEGSDISMNPEDYFLLEVSSVKAYYNDFTLGKIYVDLDKLPLDEYIRFEAETYTPSLAVDIDMYPVSSSDDCISIDGDVVYVNDVGSSTILLESLTGATFEVNVSTQRPQISEISVSHTSSDIEYDFMGDESYSVYVGQTYEDILVSVRPSGADINDIGVTVSDPSVLKVEEGARYSSSISYTYTVLDNNDAHSVDVTFYSISNPEIKATYTYRIKDALTEDTRYEILMSNTYYGYSVHDNNIHIVLTFESRTSGHLQYYYSNELIAETDFTYSLNGLLLNIEISNADYPYQYNGGEVTLDCQNITLTVDDVTYVHYFDIVESEA